MNPTRVLGAILFVVGVAWFLALPAVLPAAYHGHVHTGHEHVEYSARPVVPGAQPTSALVDASRNAADAAPERNWTVVRTGALGDTDRRAIAAAVGGTANATEPSRRDRYRRLAATYRYAHHDGRWVELALTDRENYTVLQAAPTDAATVTRAVALEPRALPDRAESQARTLVRSDGPVILSDPALPTPLYVEDGAGDVHLLVRLGPPPPPPATPALVLVLIPGVILAVLGAFLGVRG